jgi:hypothetical protein
VQLIVGHGNVHFINEFGNRLAFKRIASSPDKGRDRTARVVGYKLITIIQGWECFGNGNKKVGVVFDCRHAAVLETFRRVVKSLQLLVVYSVFVCRNPSSLSMLYAPYLGVHAHDDSTMEL